MKRILATLSLVAVATSAASAASPGPAAHGTTIAKGSPKCRVAPADEYFGKLKMSILGIRNTIKDQGLKIDVFPEKTESTWGSIAFVEDALHDWQKKYPCDSWLPTSVYALEHFYTKIHTDEGVKHVHATFAWLHRDWPRHRLHQVAQKEDSEATAAPAQTAAGAEAKTETK